MNEAWLGLLAAIGGGFGAGSGFLMFANRKLIAPQELTERLRDEAARTDQERLRAERYEQEIIRLNAVHVDAIIPNIQQFTLAMQEQTSLLRQFFQAQIQHKDS